MTLNPGDIFITTEHVVVDAKFVGFGEVFLYICKDESSCNARAHHVLRLRDCRVVRLVSISGNLSLDTERIA